MDKFCMDIPPGINFTFINPACDFYIALGPDNAAIHFNGLNIIARYLKT